MRNHNAEYQDNQTRKYAYDFDSIIRRYLLRTLSPHFVPGGTALELGCYKGDMTEQLLDFFPCITVVEAAGELASIVRERFLGRVEVINSTFETARIDASFDNVFLIHTLEHLDERVAVLARIQKWLSRHGRLFVAVPNASALSRQIAVKMGLIEHHTAVTPAEAAHGHRCTYTMDVLLSELCRAGYRIADYGGVLVKPLANFQFDRALAQGIINEAYLEACHELARSHPDLAASLYVVCTRRV
jgi:2-polyprenyl-3-methyl-5-hydroxy-6-metoxy-1,4-benzoquinol methylase